MGATPQKTTIIRALIVVVALIAAEMCVIVPAQAAFLVANVTTSPALMPSFINESSYHTGTTGTASSILDVQAYPFYPGGVGPIFGYHGIGTASADFLKLGASSRVILNNFSPSSYASNTLILSQAQADDDITVPGSGPGFFQLLFHLSGSAASSNASLMQGGVFFTSSIGSQTGVNVNSFSLGFLPTGDLQSSLVPITLGVPFHIRGFLQTSMVVVGSGDDVGPIDAGIFFGNTAAITGVNVFDANGTQLTSFTILSDSGTDYAHIVAEPQGVPAPSTIVMLSLGVATAWMLCGRKLYA